MSLDRRSILRGLDAIGGIGLAGTAQAEGSTPDEVMTNAVIHGDTGIGIPLEPRQYLSGAFWGAGDLLINGEVADTNREVHFMTTEVVRNEEYELAIGEDLPLGEDEAFAGQSHHTHGILPPIEATPHGPEFDPVSTAFELPNGETQPFIHITFDEDTVCQR